MKLAYLPSAAPEAVYPWARRLIDDLNRAPQTAAGNTSPASADAAGTMSAADYVKLAGVQSGATANSSDAYLLDRAHHVGEQAASSISDFPTAVRDTLGAGSNIGLLYNPATRITTISASSSGVGSFNARSGAVTLISGDVTGALGYTPTSVTSLTGAQTVAAFKAGLSLVKGDVGLGSVTNALQLVAANNLSDLTAVSTARTNLGLGTLATQSGTFSGTSSGTNTGDQTTITGNAGTATKLATARNINGVAFDGTAAITINAVDSTAREPAITAGTTAQYWRGDKSWQTLNAAAVAGLGTMATQVASSVAITGGTATFGTLVADSATYFKVNNTTNNATVLLDPSGAAGEGWITATNSAVTAQITLAFRGSKLSFRPAGTEVLSINGALGNYANDAAAAAGGVPVLGMYRNGSVLMVRVV